MPYVSVEKFLGLDSRRSELTTTPGALLTLSNGHINQGGEIEKRKAFIRTALPTGCFGLESTDAGLVTFIGNAVAVVTVSRARVGGVATITVAAGHGFFAGDAIAVTGLGAAYDLSVVITSVTATTILYPAAAGTETTTADTDGLITFVSRAGVSVQLLRHPVVGIFGVTYSETYHALASVAWSTGFDGKAFVCATFADGFSFLFYNGTPVASSYSGIVFKQSGTPGSAYNAIAVEDMIDGFASVGWNAYALDSVTTGTYSQGGIGFSPASIDFSPVASKSLQLLGGTGSLGFLQGSEALPASAGFGKQTVFLVVGSAGKKYMAYGTGSADSTTYFPICEEVDWTTETSDDLTAVRIVANINARTAETGYTAISGGANVVNIFSPVLAGSFTIITGGTFTWAAAKLIETTTPTDITLTGQADGAYSHEAPGQVEYFAFSGQWTFGDYWSASITSDSGDFTLGRGYLGNGWWSGGDVTVPASALTLNDRVYLANGSRFNFSGLSSATGWEEQNVGAGYVLFNSQYGNADLVKALAPYQGRLAVLGSQSVQVWQINADPTLFALQQTLPNIGTIASDSVKSLGDLDVMFLHDSGVRSLRARNDSLNAFVNDIGSPIDLLVQAKLATCSAAEKAAACGIVEPESTRYWLFIKDTIYVLSYFPSLKIVGWSTYLPTHETIEFDFAAISTDDGSPLFGIQCGPATEAEPYGIYIKDSTAEAPWTFAEGLANVAAKINAEFANVGYVATVSGTKIVIAMTTIPFNGRGWMTPDGSPAANFFAFTAVHTTFVPQKFVVHNGLVYVRTGLTDNAIYAYGGAVGALYDHSTITATLPWQHANKPATFKQAKGVDVVWTGDWSLYVGQDFESGTRQVVYLSTYKSFLRGGVPVNGRGTHFSLQAISSAASKATLSSLIFHYNEANTTI